MGFQTWEHMGYLSMVPLKRNGLSFVYHELCDFEVFLDTPMARSWQVGHKWIGSDVRDRRWDSRDNEQQRRCNGSSDCCIWFDVYWRQGKWIADNCGLMWINNHRGYSDVLWFYVLSIESLPRDQFFTLLRLTQQDTELETWHRLGIACIAVQPTHANVDLQVGSSGLVLSLLAFYWKRKRATKTAFTGQRMASNRLCIGTGRRRGRSREVHSGSPMGFPWFSGCEVTTVPGRGGRGSRISGGMDG